MRTGLSLPAIRWQGIKKITLLLIESVQNQEIILLSRKNDKIIILCLEFYSFIIFPIIEVPENPIYDSKYNDLIWCLWKPCRLKVCTIFFLERERTHMCKQGGGQGGRERELQAGSTPSMEWSSTWGSMWGLIP